MRTIDIINTKWWYDFQFCVDNIHNYLIGFLEVPLGHWNVVKLDRRPEKNNPEKICIP
jgi:hypothetical protein